MRTTLQELHLPLTHVSDWTCIAPSADKHGECGRRHAIHKQGWHLWRCKACGAPRWEGPGWQLQQRLAAALQAGAALEDTLLPPHGDAPMAAAAAAAQAALARFRWEAAGAGAASSAPPDATAQQRGSGSGSDSPKGDSGAVAAAAFAAAGLPNFERGDEFRSLAELAARMLAHSSEWGWAGVVRAGLDVAWLHNLCTRDGAGLPARHSALAAIPPDFSAFP